MRIFYLALLLILVASLVGLETVISRLPHKPMSPIRARDSVLPTPGIHGA